MISSKEFNVLEPKQAAHKLHQECDFIVNTINTNESPKSMALRMTLQWLRDSVEDGDVDKVDYFNEIKYYLGFLEGDVDEELINNLNSVRNGE